MLPTELLSDPIVTNALSGLAGAALGSWGGLAAGRVASRLDVIKGLPEHQRQQVEAAPFDESQLPPTWRLWITLLPQLAWMVVQWWRRRRMLRLIDRELNRRGAIRVEAVIVVGLLVTMLAAAGASIRDRFDQAAARSAALESRVDDLEGSQEVLEFLLDCDIQFGDRNPSPPFSDGSRVR